MRTPRAQQIQGHSNGDDDALTAIARRSSPGRRWWWGVRRWLKREVNVYDFGRAGEFEGFPQDTWQTGAWCYLCNAPIATWDRRWEITVTARLAIQRHRTDHIQGRLDEPAQEITA